MRPAVRHQMFALTRLGAGDRVPGTVSAGALDEIDREQVNAETFHLVAETIREVGILILVFGPLDEWIRVRDTTQKAAGEATGSAPALGPDWVFIGVVLAMGIALIAGGIWVQRLVSSYAKVDT